KLPAGLAEFRNDGTFVRTLALPKEAPYGYDVAIKPGLNRMVTSSFTTPSNYKKPFAKMDLKAFGNTLTFWDFRARKPLCTVKVGVQPTQIHVTCDGKRKYVTNSLLSTLDRSDEFWVKLVRIGPDGMKVDPRLSVDLTKVKVGKKTRKFRGHDMLLN